jgi:general stress protein 26
MSLKEKEKIVAIMKENCLFAFLATSDGDQPHVRPVSPIVEDDMTIWVATYTNSRKVKQIRQNSKISLAFVKHPEGEKTAIVIGTAEIIAHMDEKKRIWKIAPYDMSRHFKTPESKELCLLKINPQKIEWWDDWATGRKVFP